MQHHRLCPTIVDVKPPAPSVHPERRDSETVEGRTALHTAAPCRLRPRSPVPAPLRLVVTARSTNVRRGDPGASAPSTLNREWVVGVFRQYLAARVPFFKQWGG